MNRTLSKIKKPTWVANHIKKIITDHQGLLSEFISTINVGILVWIKMGK